MTTIRQFAGITEEAREDFTGADGTGSSGNLNRIFSLTTLNQIDAVKVFLDGVLLTSPQQYGLTNKQITIILPVWDDQRVDFIYDE